MIEIVALVVRIVLLAAGATVLITVFSRWPHLDSATRSARCSIAALLCAGSALIGGWS